jgi:hypothetical protein
MLAQLYYYHVVSEIFTYSIYTEISEARYTRFFHSWGDYTECDNQKIIHLPYLVNKYGKKIETNNIFTVNNYIPKTKWHAEKQTKKSLQG